MERREHEMNRRERREHKTERREHETERLLADPGGMTPRHPNHRSRCEPG
jgi:hypothetical protein